MNINVTLKCIYVCNKTSASYLLGKANFDLNNLVKKYSFWQLTIISRLVPKFNTYRSLLIKFLTIWKQSVSTITLWIFLYSVHISKINKITSSSFPLNFCISMPKDINKQATSIKTCSESVAYFNFLKSILHAASSNVVKYLPFALPTRLH